MMDNYIVVTLFHVCLLASMAMAQFAFTTPAGGNAVAGDAVPEDTNAAILVETLATSGGSGTITYSVVSQDGDTDTANHLFEVTDTTALKTKATSTFDYETKSSYVLIVKAVDSTADTALTASATVTVSITDVNDAPTWPAYQLIGCISSSSTTDDVVGTFTATDPDTTSPNNEIASYAITGGDGGQFTATSSGMIKRTSTPLDIVAQNWYELVYTATDSGATPATGTTTVYVALDSPLCASGAISPRGRFLGLAIIIVSLLSVQV